MVFLKNLFALVVLCSSIRSGYCQSDKQRDLILTNDQNRLWLDRLATGSVNEQLELVKQRFISDTAIYVRHSYPDRINVNSIYKNEKRIEGACKPMIVCHGQIFYVTNCTSVGTIKKLVNLLSPDNIKGIQILRDATASAIYGSRAGCGVIMLQPVNKKAERKFKSLVDGLAESENCY
jgi:TonB-dependent SusC/RagA subfamily outer membrane receptor